MRFARGGGRGAPAVSAGGGMKSRLILFVLGLAVWAVLTWPPTARACLFGPPASLLAALLAGEMFVRRPYALKDPLRYAYFALYLPLFVWECVKGNIHVARLICHPDLPINPGIVKVRTRLKSETGLALLDCSITLTPGTMTVDTDPDGGFIYVHWIDVKAVDVDGATRRIVDIFERILVRIFE